MDVEARLASLEAQRESLNAMLAQAQDVETLLAVQRELADVQYEIESYTAQKRTYDDQIAYSTVQVTVRLRPEQHKQLKAAAFHRDCDMSELVRQALDQFFA